MNQNIKEIKMKANLIVEAIFFCGVVKDLNSYLHSVDEKLHLKRLFAV